MSPVVNSSCVSPRDMLKFSSAEICGRSDEGGAAAVRQGMYVYMHVIRDIYMYVCMSIEIYTLYMHGVRSMYMYVYV